MIDWRRFTQLIECADCFTYMRQDRHQKKKRSWVGADNPSVMWLAFAPTFLLPWLYAVGGWLLATMAMVMGIGVVLLFAKGTERHHHSWRLWLFLPPMILQLSTLFCFYVSPQWHISWGLLSIALAAGWLWSIEGCLSKDSPLSVEEWIFSAKLFGIGSLLYLILYQGWLYSFGWAEFAPALLIVAGVVGHQVKINRSLSRSQLSFSCPLGTPLVRMAIVKGNQLWLTNRPYTGCFTEDKEIPCHMSRYRDLPLTSCVNLGQTPEETLHRAYISTGLKLQEEPKFLLKYSYASSPQQERTVYLFVLNLKSQHHQLPLRGQFFSPQVIEELIDDGYFTPLFIEEYAYLKNTLMRANELTKKATT